MALQKNEIEVTPILKISISKYSVLFRRYLALNNPSRFEFRFSILKQVKREYYFS